MKKVVIHPTLEYYNPGFIDIWLKRISKLIKHAESKNIKVAFENMELKGYLEFILENIESNNVGICFDIGHCNLFFNGEFNTKAFKDKVFAIHLHDNFKKIDEHNLPFDGNVDWEKTIDQIIDMNYCGYITIESGYNDYYSNISIEEYYNNAFIIANKLSSMIEERKKNIIIKLEK